MFVLGHYLFLDAHSFPRAMLSENCSLLGTDDVRGQISVHIFARNGDYCLYILSLLLKYGAVHGNGLLVSVIIIALLKLE